MPGLLASAADDQLEGIKESVADELTTRLAARLLGIPDEAQPVEIVKVIAEAPDVFDIFYKLRSGTLTQHDIWDAGRLAVKLGDNAWELIPMEYRPLSAGPALATWLTLKAGVPWLYCMEAAFYVDQDAARWLGERLRPIVQDLIAAHSVGAHSDLVEWLDSFGESGPPAMPTGLTATPQGPRVIDLRWEDRSADETAFVISNGEEERRVGRDQTSYRWAVSPGSYMCAKVQAVNDDGDSSWYPDHDP